MLQGTEMQAFHLTCTVQTDQQAQVQTLVKIWHGQLNINDRHLVNNEHFEILTNYRQVENDTVASCAYIRRPSVSVDYFLQRR